MLNKLKMFQLHFFFRIAAAEDQQYLHMMILDCNVRASIFPYIALLRVDKILSLLKCPDVQSLR